MLFVDDLFLSLKAEPSFCFFFFFFGVPWWLRNLGVQRRGSGFWGAVFSTPALARGIGGSMISPYFCVYGSSGWASVMVPL